MDPIQVGDYVSVDGQQYLVDEVTDELVYIRPIERSALYWDGKQWQVVNSNQQHQIAFRPGGHILNLPEEMILSVIANLSVDDTLNLCRTDPVYLPLCQNWSVIASYKYPEIDWSKISSQDALKIDRALGKGAYQNAFLLAVEANHLELVKYLSTLYGVDPTSEINLAIRKASQRGHLDVVRYLSTLPGVDPAAMGNYAIESASWEGHSRVVRFLLSLPAVRDGLSREDIDRHTH